MSLLTRYEKKIVNVILLGLNPDVMAGHAKDNMSNESWLKLKFTIFP